MNFQEGMRRIGLTVGVLGALGTAYVAFSPFSELVTERRAQAQFGSLLKLPITRKIAQDVAKEKIANTYVEIQGHPQGIAQIRVNDKSEIDWFTLEDGKAVFRTQAPSALWYLLYPLIVASGFLLPWGAVRLITWIISGFIGGSLLQKT